MGQALLFPPDAPNPTDPKVRAQDVKPLSAQATIIYQHLALKRSCTVAELEAVSGSRRIAARVMDVKRWLEALGSTTTIEGRYSNEETRQYIYELKEHP